MSEQLPEKHVKHPMETYELHFHLYRADTLKLLGKVSCEDILSIDFEPQTGKYFVANLEGPDSWHGEDADKLEAILKYLHARLGLSAENRPRFICPTCGYEEPEQ